MRVNTKIQYSVRALFDIAFYAMGEPAQVKDIARRQSISPTYLEQIFHRLKAAGLLEARRGRRGGYNLAKKPEDITLGEVIRAVEGPMELVFCVGEERGRPRCTLAGRCVTTHVWKELGDRIVQFFDTISIADLCTRARRMGMGQEIAGAS